MPDQKVRCLVISDLHAGMKRFLDMWDEICSSLIRNIEEHKEPIDLIIFCGDLVAKGSERSQFEKATEILLRIQTAASRDGFLPKIISTPGNHDLARPVEFFLEAESLKTFFQNKNVQEEVLKGRKGKFGNFFERIFSNYTEWEKEAQRKGLLENPLKKGIFPGDALYQIDTYSGVKVGVCALNSTWLQLDSSVGKGGVYVHPRQLKEVTNVTSSVSSNDVLHKNLINFLLTHQPPSYFGKISELSWDEHVLATNRFDVHFYGHIHEFNAIRFQKNGMEKPVECPAYSLFGVEEGKDKEENDRIHGYAIIEISVPKQDPINRKFTASPRRYSTVTQEFSPDTQQHKLIDSELSYPYQLDNPTLKKNSDQLVKIEQLSIPDLPLLEPLKVSYLKAHCEVRELERKKATDLLLESRYLFVLGALSNGPEGFVCSLLQILNIKNDQAFSIDLKNFREDFLKREAKTLFFIKNIDFNNQKEVNFLNKLKTKLPKNIYLVFQGVEPAQMLTPDPDSLVIRPLKEREKRKYIKSLPNAVEYLGTDQVLDDILNHTDGLPEELEEVFNRLRFGEKQIQVSDSDYGGSLFSPKERLGWMDAWDRLESSSCIEDKKAFTLLKTLIFLPAGESLEQLQSFLRKEYITPEHAKILIKAGLAHFINEEFVFAFDRPSEELLQINREVRDYSFWKLTQTDKKILGEQYDRLMDVIFYQDKSSFQKTFTEINRGKFTLTKSRNFRTLLLRKLREILQLEGDFEKQYTEKFLRLIIEVADTYNDNAYFRHMRDLTKECIQEISYCERDDLSCWKDALERYYAKGLGMTGHHQSALSIYEKYFKREGNKFDSLNKKQKESILLNKALAEESLGYSTSQPELLRKQSKEADLHLQAINVSLKKGITEKSKQLVRLSNKAKKIGADHLAANILLRLDSPTLKQLNQAVTLSLASKCYYTWSRSLVKLVKKAFSEGWSLTPQALEALGGVLHYSLTENRNSKTIWYLLEKAQSNYQIVLIYLSQNKHQVCIGKILVPLKLKAPEGKDILEIKPF